MARILKDVTFPPTTDWVIFTWSCSGPHFLQMTVEPRTVFVTVFALAAATASRGGNASAITHAAIVRTRLATRLKVAEPGPGDQATRGPERLRRRPTPVGA